MDIYPSPTHNGASAKQARPCEEPNSSGPFHSHLSTWTDETLLARKEEYFGQACQAIAPSWPLDRAIAVNPHWKRINLPVHRVASRLGLLAGMRVFPSRDYFLRAWKEGRVTPADLTAAQVSLGLEGSKALSVANCLQQLRVPLPVKRLPLLLDVLNHGSEKETHLSWRQAITHQVSQTCAAFFDSHQADWQPDRHQGLYDFWRDTLSHDRGIGTLTGLTDIQNHLHLLPRDRSAVENWVLQRLNLPGFVWPHYMEASLLTVQGWASWCAYLGWQACLEEGTDPHLRDLLAICLAWEALLLECSDKPLQSQALEILHAEWFQWEALLEQAEAQLLYDEVWQVALEKGYQRQLLSSLSSAPFSAAASGNSTGSKRPQSVQVQAAFCIDVRSEPMRRSLETVWPAVQTIGFAGFFGLPIAYTPLGTNARRPQLPGLLSPGLEATDEILSPIGDGSPVSKEMEHELKQARTRHFVFSGQWLAASRWPGAALPFVETAGASYLNKLVHWLQPSTHSRVNDDYAGVPSHLRHLCRPALANLDLPAKVSLAGKVLHSMGLERNIAPLVVLVGHGSQSANNAQAAALDCGACCGQTGEVNARLLAQLLNDPSVRSGLDSQGISIPESTVFLSALHNTTTDEIEWFDLDLLPSSARMTWEKLQGAFSRASDKVRRERAALLGLNPQTGSAKLLTQLRRRANDGAQTRPEWGLGGNAAFIIAPRSRTRGISLGGRCFLHDYEAAQDPDGAVLELLMTAPMLVTHWINWQYHASTCDPVRLGSGNKLLHNVVGGHIGVFEGNGGDLRIGLARQSLHDGERWVHEPLRLTVIIDAPAAAIEQVIHKHEAVRQLVDNGWLYLCRFNGAGVDEYHAGSWRRLVADL